MRAKQDYRSQRVNSRRGSLSLSWMVILAAVAALVVFLFWPESAVVPRDAGHSAEQSAVHSEDGEQHEHAHENGRKDLYTCGMHPNVLSEEPGSCPICGMHLTPVVVETADSPSSARSGERKVKYWRAPMDPNYISETPGKSPMGMDLVPVYEDETSAGTGTTIRISPVVVQNMGVRTAVVERSDLVRTIRTVGTIDYDEPLVRDVTTKFEGWIEKLYVDYTGQAVEKGAPLFTVYSRELYSSQEEYLLALRNQDTTMAKDFPDAARDMEQLVESSRLRLELFDISAEQIRELEQRGTPSKNLTMLSPHSGIVVEKMARDGMRVTPGMKLYTIADLSRVWVYVDIYENEVPFVKIGQQARMDLSYLPGEVFTGKVVYVYPFVATQTRTVKVRLEFDNPHMQLKPGMFANIRIDADLGRSGLVVPRSAIIDTGERQIAFVSRGEGRFEARQISVGFDLGSDSVEVREGLSEGEPVVTSGQFLLDSESKLREAVLKMIEQRKGKASSQELAASPADDTTTQVEATRDAGGADISAEAVPGSAASIATDLAPVLERYLEIQKGLAAGSARRAGEAATMIGSPLAELNSAARGLEGPSAAIVADYVETARAAVTGMRGRSLDSMRAQFQDLSRAVIGLLTLAGEKNLGGNLRVFSCPMAGGEWVQRGDEPANPYYGFSMLRCGDPAEIGGSEK